MVRVNFAAAFVLASCRQVTGFATPVTQAAVAHPTIAVARSATSETVRLYDHELRHDNFEVGAWWNPLALGATLGIVFALLGGSSAAIAVDAENGKATFEGVCAACHAGGSNAVKEGMTLQKDMLVKNGRYDVTQIKAIVSGGQNTMPAFGALLEQKEIEDVAQYVYETAEKGWS